MVPACARFTYSPHPELVELQQRRLQSVARQAYAATYEYEYRNFSDRINIGCVAHGLYGSLYITRRRCEGRIVSYYMKDTCMDF